MRKRPVVQLKNSKPKAIFSSIQVTKNYGFVPTDVNFCAQGVRKNHAGHQWKYLNEESINRINTAKKGKDWQKITSRTIQNYGLSI